MQTDIASKGLRGSKTSEERGEPQRGPTVIAGVTAAQTTDGLLIARFTPGPHPHVVILT